jgi:lysophospholipase L1-like esterase
LAFVATLGTLLALEAALRFLDAFTAVDVFAAPSAARRTPRPNAALDLGDLIRPAADKDLVYELRPGVRGTFVGARVKIGAHGGRGAPAESRDDGAIRVVGLGDSITFGWGVPEHATFLGQLRRRFRSAHPGGPPLEVVNMGVPGYNTYQEVEAFLSQAASLRPDIVILFLCDNDDELPNFVRKHDPFAVRRSYLWDLVADRVRQLASAPPSSALERTKPARATRSWRTNDAALAPPAYRHMVGIEAVEGSLRRLAGYSRDRHVPVIYAGTGGELDALVRPLAHALGFVVIDDLDDVVEAHLARSNRSATSLRLSATDLHPNPELHAIIGRRLSEAVAPLVARSLLARASRPGD